MTVRTAARRLLLNDAGVSLIELLIVCMLLPIVLGSGYLLMESGSTMSHETDARQQATNESRNALAKLTTEFRQAVEIAEDNGAFSIAEARRCAFYSDVDHDNVPELVQYRIVGTTLMRSVAEATTVSPPFSFSAASAETTIARGVPSSWTGAVFTYYNGSNPPAAVSSADRAQASAVAIHLVNSAMVAQHTVKVDLATWVKIRSIHNSID